MKTLRHTHIMKLIFIAISTLLIAGCALLGSGESGQQLYDQAQNQADDMATRGEITWVKAAEIMRRADMEIAKSPDYPNWKYNNDDEEFHSFCIAIAEKVDRGTISIADYRAARIQKRNAIDARRRSLSLQAQQVRNSASNSSGIYPAQIRTTCQLTKEISRFPSTHCIYDCAGSEVIRTVGAANICPLTIQN